MLQHLHRRLAKGVTALAVMLITMLLVQALVAIEDRALHANGRAHAVTPSPAHLPPIWQITTTIMTVNWSRAIMMTTRPTWPRSSLKTIAILPPHKALTATMLALRFLAS